VTFGSLVQSHASDERFEDARFRPESFQHDEQQNRPDGGYGPADHERLAVGGRTAGGTARWAAYSLVRFHTGGENLAVWIISQRMMPPIAIVFPVFLIFVWFGLVDTYTGLILLYTAFNLPYVIWMMRGYISEVPIELEESARVDGCTRLGVLLKVVFPMVRTGLFATAVFTFVFAWNEFLFALVLTRTEVVTYPVQVTHYFGGQSNFWAKIAALSVLGTLPIFVAVAGLQRFLVRGISMGAVKG